MKRAASVVISRHLNVTEFAGELCMPITPFLNFISAAGLSQRVASDFVSDEDRALLLGYLRRMQGNVEQAQKVKLTRKQALAVKHAKVIAHRAPKHVAIARVRDTCEPVQRENDQATTEVESNTNQKVHDCARATMGAKLGQQVHSIVAGEVKAEREHQNRAIVDTKADCDGEPAAHISPSETARIEQHTRTLAITREEYDQGVKKLADARLLQLRRAKEINDRERALVTEANTEEYEQQTRIIILAKAEHDATAQLVQRVEQSLELQVQDLPVRSRQPPLFGRTAYATLLQPNKVKVATHHELQARSFPDNSSERPFKDAVVNPAKSDAVAATVGNGLLDFSKLQQHCEMLAKSAPGQELTRVLRWPQIASLTWCVAGAFVAAIARESHTPIFALGIIMTAIFFGLTYRATIFSFNCGRIFCVICGIALLLLLTDEFGWATENTISQVRQSMLALMGLWLVLSVVWNLCLNDFMPLLVHRRWTYDSFRWCLVLFSCAIAAFALTAASIVPWKELVPSIAEFAITILKWYQSSYLMLVLLLGSAATILCVFGAAVHTDWSGVHAPKWRLPLVPSEQIPVDNTYVRDLRLASVQAINNRIIGLNSAITKMAVVWVCSVLFAKGFGIRFAGILGIHIKAALVVVWTCMPVVLLLVAFGLLYWAAQLFNPSPNYQGFLQSLFALLIVPLIAFVATGAAFSCAFFSRSALILSIKNAGLVAMFQAPWPIFFATVAMALLKITPWTFAFLSLLGLLPAALVYFALVYKGRGRTPNEASSRPQSTTLYRENLHAALLCAAVIVGTLYFVSAYRAQLSVQWEQFIKRKADGKRLEGQDLSQPIRKPPANDGIRRE